MLKDRDKLVSKHLFVQSANTSPYIFVPICVSPIIFLCVLVTYCLSDKAFIFPLCKFFPLFSWVICLEPTLLFWMELLDVKTAATVFVFTTTFTQDSLSHSQVWTFFSSNFSFPLRTKQSLLSCNGEKVWNHSQGHPKFKQQWRCRHSLHFQRKLVRKFIQVAAVKEFDPVILSRDRNAAQSPTNTHAHTQRSYNMCHIWSWHWHHWHCVFEGRVLDLGSTIVFLRSDLLNLDQPAVPPVLSCSHRRQSHGAGSLRDCVKCISRPVEKTSLQEQAHKNTNIKLSDLIK